MFLLTNTLLEEREAEPQYYIEPEYIELLAINKNVRTAFLRTLNKTSAVIASSHCVDSSIFLLPSLENTKSTCLHSKI